MGLTVNCGSSLNSHLLEHSAASFLGDLRIKLDDAFSSP